MGQEINSWKVGVVVDKGDPVEVAMTRSNSEQTMDIGEHAKQHMGCLHGWFRMRSTRELAIDAVFAEITDVRDSDMIWYTCQGLCADELPNRVEGNVIQPGVQVHDGNGHRLRAKAGTPIQVGKGISTHSCSKLYSTCLSIDPFVNRVQDMYGPWLANLLSPSCKCYSIFNIYSMFYVQL